MHLILAKGEKVDKKKFIGLILAIIFVALGVFITPPDGLSHEGAVSIGILCALLTCWITSCVPMAISCITGMFLLYTLGVGADTEIMGGFMSSIMLFVIAMFAFAAVMQKTNICKRIIGLILKWSGVDGRKIVIGFFIGSFIVSSFMSAIPVCAMFAGLALSLLKDESLTEEQREEYKPLAKALMIAIPSAALFGNIVTPAGNSINAFIMAGYETVTGTPFTFGQWVMFGAPFAIVTGAISLLLLIKMFKVGNLRQESVDRIIEETKSLGKLDSQEIKFLVIFVVMVGFWIAGIFGLTWPSYIDISIICLVLLFLPGIDLLTGKEFIKAVSWDMVFMGGVLMILVSVLQSTGAVTFLVDAALGDVSAWPFIVTLIVMALVPCIVHMAIPVAGAIYGIAFMPLALAAAGAGINPLIPAMMVGIWMNLEFILPTDMIYLITYAHGYYEFKDTIKFGVPTTIITLVLSVIWVPIIMNAF